MFKGIAQNLELKLTLSQLPFFEPPGTVPFALNLTHLKGYLKRKKPQCNRDELLVSPFKKPHVCL